MDGAAARVAVRHSQRIKVVTVEVARMEVTIREVMMVAMTEMAMADIWRCPGGGNGGGEGVSGGGGGDGMHLFKTSIQKRRIRALSFCHGADAFLKAQRAGELV